MSCTFQGFYQSFAYKSCSTSWKEHVHVIYALQYLNNHVLLIHVPITHQFFDLNYYNSHLASRLGGIKQKKSSWGSAKNNKFLLFYSPKTLSQVWILIYRNWSIKSAICNHAWPSTMSITVALTISVFQKTLVTGKYHCLGLHHEHASYSQKKDSLIKEDDK